MSESLLLHFCYLHNQMNDGCHGSHLMGWLMEHGGGTTDDKEQSTCADVDNDQIPWR